MKKVLIGIAVLLVAAGGAWYFLGRTSDQKAQGTPTPSVATSSTPSVKCIITIDGQKYDVTSFKSIHPGGDVFRCGTDMSTAFHAQHGDGAKQLQQIQNLKVN